MATTIMHNDSGFHSDEELSGNFDPIAAAEINGPFGPRRVDDFTVDTTPLLGAYFSGDEASADHSPRLEVASKTAIPTPPRVKPSPLIKRERPMRSSVHPNFYSDEIEWYSAPRQAKQFSKKSKQRFDAQTREYTSQLEREHRKCERRVSLMMRRLRSTKMEQQGASMSNLMSLPSKASTTLDEAGTFFKTMNGTASMTAAQFAKALQVVKSTSFKALAVANGSLIAIKWICDPPHFFTMIIDVFQFVLNSLAFIFKDQLSEITTQLISLFQSHVDEIPNVAQVNIDMGEDEIMTRNMMQESDPAAMLPLLGSAVTLLATGLIGKKVQGNPLLAKSLDGYGKLGRSMRGIKNMAEDSLTLARWIFDTLKALVLDTTSSTLMDGSATCQLLGLTTARMAEIDKLIDPASLSQNLMRDDFKYELQKAATTLNAFCADMHVAKEPNRLVEYCKVRLVEARKILKENAAVFQNVAGYNRPVPFLVQFFGAPGSRKSTIMTDFSRLMLTQEACGRVLDNQGIYSRAGATRYWDNFNGETCMIIDDGFMTRGATPAESEYAQLIVLKSNVSMVIPKASIPDKGMTADSIRLITLTSNTEVPKATEINNSEALLRRRDIVWETFYNEPGVPPEALNSEMFPGVTFRRKHNLTQQYLSGHIPFETMFLISAGEFKQWMNVQDQLVVKKELTPYLRANLQQQMNYSEEMPCYYVDDMSDFGYKMSGIRVPLYTNLPDLASPASVYRAGYTCCSPVKIYCPSRSNVAVCNATQEITSLDSWQSLDLKVCDIPFSSLSYEHAEMFGEACEYDLLLPPHSLMNKIHLPVWSEVEEAWEAMRMVSRARRVNGIEEQICRRYCYESDYESYDDHDFALDGVHLELKGPFIPAHLQVRERITHENDAEMIQADLDLENEWFEILDLNQQNDPAIKVECKVCADIPAQAVEHLGQSTSTGISVDIELEQFGYIPELDVFNEQVEYEPRNYVVPDDEVDEPEGRVVGHVTPKTRGLNFRCKFLLAALGVLGMVFLGVSMFKLWQKLKGSKDPIPQLDYSQQSLDKFVESAPEYARERLMSSVLKECAAMEHERALAMQALAYDGALAKHHVANLGMQGLVYDASLSKPQPRGMTIQSEFNKHKIDTVSSRAMVRSLQQESDQLLAQQRLISENMVFISKPGAPSTMIHGVMIEGRRMLVPYHISDGWKDGDVMSIKWANGVVENETFELKRLTKLLNIDNIDTACYEFKSTRLARKITGFLLRERDLRRLEASCPLIFQKGYNATLTHGKVITKSGITYGPSAAPRSKTLANCLVYNAPTVNGDCGVPLLVSLNTIQGILCGIHVAGANGSAMASLVTYEMWQNALPASPDLEPEGLEVMEMFMEQESDTLFIENGKKIQNSDQLPAVGLVKKSYATVPLARSDLRLSPLTKVMKHTGQKFFDSERAQPVFSLRDPRVDRAVVEAGIQPMSKGVNKYAALATPLRPGCLAIAYATVLSALLSISPSFVEKRLLTFSETLNGIPGVLKRIDIHTSPGWPYVKMTCGVQGKRALIKVNEMEDGQDDYELDLTDTAIKYGGRPLAEYFKERYDIAEKKIREGLVPTYFAYENMKDELRGEKKIREANTRTFDCLPLEITLLTRKYFGVFVGALEQKCVESVVSVGINPTGLDWTRLKQRLSKFGGQHLIAGDYKNWDGFFSSELMTKCADLINRWYNDCEENQRARRALIYSFIHSYLLVLNTVVQKRSGMPSGVPLTAPVNSLGNWLYLLAIICEILEDAGEEVTPDILRENFEIAAYGDDHAVAVSPNYIHLVTFMKIQKTFENHGVIYTDSQKREGVEFDFEPLSEITYLKRRFVNDPIRPMLVRAPLALASITDMVYWIRSSNKVNDIVALQARIKSFTDELAMHDRTTYEDCVATLNASLETAREHSPEWATLLNNITLEYDQVTQWVYGRLGSV